MSSDLDQIRQLLSRREAIVLLGTTAVVCLMSGRQVGAQSFVGIPSSPCIVRPEQTEGPYFVDERLHRVDIRSDPSNGTLTSGTPLVLTVQVSGIRAGECAPLPNAQVDIWHCDASGVYSDVRDPGFNTVGKKFLRGYQLTDPRGEVHFMTIYPGWYPIRTVHIHFKIRTGLVSGRRFEFTSQLYFPDEVTDQVHRGAPYAPMGQRRVRNRQDFIFRHGGEELLVEPTATNNGYAATFPIGLELG